MRRHLFGSMLVAVITVGTTAHADDDAGAQRFIAGHRFVPSLLVPWGFIHDEISSTSSFGISTISIEDRVARALQRDPDDSRFIAVAQSFAGAFAVTPGFGLSARLTASSLVPRDAFSAFVVGATEAYGVDLGATTSVACSTHSRICRSSTTCSST